MQKPILISGAGIAGLTAALCLAKQGFHVEVFEKSEGFETIGAGIQISPNAFSVLQSLGLGNQLRNIATIPEAISIRKASSGKEITRIPLGLSATKRFGYPYVVIHRADLQNMLFAMCKEERAIKVHFSSEIIDIATHQNGVTVLTENNRKTKECHGMAMVIADGIWSNLRSNILGLNKAGFKQKIAWRALIPAQNINEIFSLEDTMLWLSKAAHAVTYPVRGGKYLNVIVITPSENDQNTGEIPASELKKQFKKWSPDFQTLFDGRASWTGWPVYEMQNIEALADGPIALIGDAAHAMLPFAAQGAAMAIEDAAVLAKELAATSDVSQALNTYEQKRLPRIKKVAKTARQNGEIYHLGPFESIPRNLVMRYSPGSFLLGRQSWIYKWRV